MVFQQCVKLYLNLPESNLLLMLLLTEDVVEQKDDG